MDAFRKFIFWWNLFAGSVLSLFGLIPYWSNQYVPFLMAYHYYSFALMCGLYVTVSHKTTKCSLVGIMIMTLMAVACGSIYFNEASLAGSEVVLGSRNYSHIAGSATSLNVETAATDDTSSTVMYSLNVSGVAIGFVTAFVDLVFVFRQLVSGRSECYRCDDEPCSSYPTSFHIMVLAILGCLIVVYYIVASLIMVTDSVVLISPVESPNTLTVFLIGICTGLPAYIKNQRVLAWIWLLPAAWLLSMAFTISTLVLVINWRAIRNYTYFAGTSMCPSPQIVQALNAHYTFTVGGSGVDQMTYSNVSSWTPETFADFTCADDAISFALTIYEFIMFIMTSVYVCYKKTTPKLTIEEQQPLNLDR